MGEERSKSVTGPTTIETRQYKLAKRVFRHWSGTEAIPKGTWFHLVLGFSTCEKERGVGTMLVEDGISPR